MVGASLAGLRAVEAARAASYQGALSLVGAEPHLPYDRPPLSKDYLEAGAPGATPHLSGPEELAALGVDLRLGEPAQHLDVVEQVLVVGGQSVPYDALVIATGAAARTLPGTDRLTGVHCLRTLDDAVAIRAALDRGARTVVVGAGFIGSEIASAARKRGLSATVLEALPVPLVRAVGEQAGAALSDLHLRNGTDLRCGVQVEGLLGTGRVAGVRLADGSELAADLVVVGVGATPSTDWLESSDLTLDNGVVCDATLLAAPGVWAAGDVSRWLSPDFGVLLRLEHWTNAADQGTHAMRNALEPALPVPYSHIPYFWSDWYGSRIQFAGIPSGEPEVVTGSWQDDAFVALYRDGDRLVGALALNRRADIMKYRALIARRADWRAALELAASRNARAAGSTKVPSPTA